MFNRLLLATKNSNKVVEFRKLLRNIELLSLNDVNVKEPEENGKTFEENSIIKAKYYGEILGLSTISDDSGLCINALNNFPSIYSSRINVCGDYNKTFDFLKILIEYNNIVDYSAHFVCNVSFYDYNKKTINSFEGICNGKINFNFKKSNGFGYDPIFIPDGYDLSFAELDIEEKNKISHRGRALEKFTKWFDKNLQNY